VRGALPCRASAAATTHASTLRLLRLLLLFAHQLIDSDAQDRFRGRVRGDARDAAERSGKRHLMREAIRRHSRQLEERGHLMKEAISAQQHRREREDDRRPRHMLIRCNQCSSEAITGESVKTIAALGTCFRIRRTISRRLATFSPTELT
jgi:hypothetical protein